MAALPAAGRVIRAIPQAIPVAVLSAEAKVAVGDIRGNGELVAGCSVDAVNRAFFGLGLMRLFFAGI